MGWNPFKDSWSGSLDPRTILNPGSMVNDQLGLTDPVDMSMGIDPAVAALGEEIGYGQAPGGTGEVAQAGFSQMPMQGLFNGDSVDPSYARGLAELGRMGYGQEQGPIFGGNYADLGAGVGNIARSY